MVCVTAHNIIKGSSLNCLLYADDLILISRSAAGLQNALSTLSQFCQDRINEDKIEVADSYTNLGIRFSTNGSQQSDLKGENQKINF